MVNISDNSFLQVANFLNYFFMEKNLKLSTIAGYRIAIVDCFTLHSVPSRLSLLYLLSLVLFGLTRQPFELFEEDFLEVISFHNDFSFDFGIRQRRKGNFC